MKKINLKSNGIGRYDDASPFLIERGALELEIELPDKSGEFYFVAELNGKKTTKPLVGGSPVTLTDLTAGELKAAVKHYLRGELIEVYKIEPLLLKTVEKELSAMPEIALLTGEIAALKKEVAALKTTADERFEATTEGFRGVTDWQRESDGALLSFAYAVYENSPLLNCKGLSFVQFAEALGFDKTEKIELGGKL